MMHGRKNIKTSNQNNVSELFYATPALKFLKCPMPFSSVRFLKTIKQVYSFLVLSLQYSSIIHDFYHRHMVVQFMRFFVVSANILMCLDEGFLGSGCSVQVAFRRIVLLQNEN